MAHHPNPESCAARREVVGEVLTGETCGPAIEPRNHDFGMPTPLSEAEGHSVHDNKCKPCSHPARSKTLSTQGSHSHGNWEISSTSGPVRPDGAGKAQRRNPVVDVDEKSDTPVVSKKLPNNGKPAEVVEKRGVAKGNVTQIPARRTQSRESASMSLDDIRQVARRDKRVRFTSLMHRLTVQSLYESFYALNRKAATGIDEVTWTTYEHGLCTRLPQLHEEIHTGRYRAMASRRVYIPKADGKLRPLGIAALEDRLVQHAVSQILSAIYEQDFQGFSYGFRQGKGQHDALDALAVGIQRRRVRWVLDADIHAFFDTIDHAWMMQFLEHRIADRRLLRLVRKWLVAGVIEDGRRIASERGCPQGAVISPVLANIYLHYVYDLWVRQWRKRYAKGDVIVVRYADDSVMGFEHEYEARRFMNALEQRLGQFGLAVNPTKTRLIRFGSFAVRDCKRQGEGKPQTFDFLGFTHFCGTSKNGLFEVKRVTVKKRMRTTLQAIGQILLRRRHEPIPVIGRWLGQVMRGYFAYFNVPGNEKRLEQFHREVRRYWMHALRRRSQRHRMTWERLNPITRHYLPYPRQVPKHPFPVARFGVMT